MVSPTLRRICAAAAAITLLGLGACQTSQQTSAVPGALPKSKTNVAPKLSASTYAAHGELLERRGNYARAIEQYRRALELSPNLVATRNRLGVTLNKVGQHSEATLEFRHALLQHPNEAYLHNNLGFSLYLENEYEEAERELTRALELQPTFRRARMNNALVLARMGRFDEALKEFAEAGSEADAYYNVAVIQAEAGLYADAARSFDQALALNPDLAAAREQLRQISRLAAAEEAARVAAADVVAARVAAAEAEAARVAAAKAREEEAARLAQQKAIEAELARRAAERAARTEALRITEETADDEASHIATTPDIAPALDTEAAMMGSNQARALSAALANLWARCARASDLIVARVAVLEDTCRSPYGLPVIGLVDLRLRLMLDDLSAAMAVTAPSTEHQLRELEQILAPVDQPF